MDIVGIHYDDIKRTFCLRDNNAKRKFNEDSFNESFIKCSVKFGNSEIDYDTVIKYFWTAYVNTCKGDNKYKSNIELCENYSEDYSNDDDECFSKKFYNDIMNAITKAFNEDDMMIYSLYKYHGWSKEELINADYDCNNFDIRIKNIHRFVKDYTKKNYKNVKRLFMKASN